MSIKHESEIAILVVESGGMHMRSTSYLKLWGMCRSMGCKHHANEIRSRLTFKLRSIFN